MDDTMEAVLLDRLCESGKTLATAESCTGGMIASRLTDIPGASQVFLGGVVSYTNGVKAHLLGVPQDLLDRFGAVSAEVAQAMAEGARTVIGADFAVSVTGVAGPSRDERNNPVGTVFIAVASERGTVVRKFAYGDRARDGIRAMAANDAICLLMEASEK